MKKNQDKKYAYQFILLLCIFAAMLGTACISSRNKEVSVKEKPSTETASENKNGDVKKSKPKTVSTVKTENARTIDADDEEENYNEVENEESDSLVKKVCRKYDSCGSQSYEDCMAEAENVNYDDEVYECMLKSSCKSLALGQPDACSGSSNAPPVYEQKQAACPQVRCTKNADCPGTCYGGCKNGICLLF